MISKAAIRAGTKAFGKSKSSKKRYKTQFEDTGPYGEPTVRDVFYRSSRNLKEQRKYMNSKFKKKSVFGTFPVSKSYYKKRKKSQREWNLETRPQRERSVKNALKDGKVRSLISKSKPIKKSYY